MKISEFICEVKIDNAKGAGAVPYNAEIDYFGLRVAMKPSTFLALALPLDEPTSKEGLKKHLQDGGAIGAPFLEVAIPPAWDDGDFSESAQIKSHEGRNRMKAIIELEGDEPIEVHIVPRGGYRARDLTDDYRKRLQAGMYAEQSKRLINGPLFN